MNNGIKVLVGCEESQAVTIEFRKLGFEAYSCDKLPCSGDHPEWHLQMDVFEAIKIIKPTLFIGHPPCTYLTVTANKWLKDQPERKSGALVGEARREARRKAIEFFIKMYNSGIEYIALENPIGAISSVFKKPDQIIQPYQFGHSASKATCLWLKNLPKILPTDIVDKGEFIEYKSGKRCSKWYADAASKDPVERERIRNKTFPGIAQAMATQWGDYLLSQQK